MVHTHRAAICVLALAAACAVPQNAWAQRAAGPFAGLFGGDVSGPPSATPNAPQTRQQLSIRWSVYGGYDDVAADAFGNVVPESEFHKSGPYSGVSAGLVYRRSSRAVRLSLNASTTARSYGSAFGLTAPAYSGGGSVDVTLGRRTTIRTYGGASFSSFYQFEPIFGILSPDFATFSQGYGAVASARDTVAWGGTVGLSQMLWRRASVSVDAGWVRREFVSSSDAPLDTRNGSVMFRQGVSRGLGIHAGYGYQEGRFGAIRGGDTPNIKTIDVGVDYSKPLSFSRRTTLTFGTGSSLIQNEQGSQYRLGVQAALTEQLGRTWSATLAYGRGAQLVEGLRDVVYGDTVMASVNGQMARRVDFAGSISALSGTVGVKQLAPALNSYTGSSKLSVALTRLVGAYIQYTYYHYDIPLGSPMALDLRPRLGRQSAMIGLTGWLPLVGDSRGRRGSR